MQIKFEKCHFFQKFITLAKGGKMYMRQNVKKTVKIKKNK